MVKRDPAAKPLLRRLDLLIIGGLLAVGLAAYFFLQGGGEVGDRAQILLDGVAVAEVSLAEDGRVEIPEAPGVVFEVSGGAIAFVHSDCPDKVCVRTGFISRSYQTAVCLPKKLMLKLYAESGDDTDMVAG